MSQGELKFAISAAYITDTHIRVTLVDRNNLNRRVQFALTSDGLMEIYRARRANRKDDESEGDMMRETSDESDSPRSVDTKFSRRDFRPR